MFLPVTPPGCSCLTLNLLMSAKIESHDSLREVNCWSSLRCKRACSKRVTDQVRHQTFFITHLTVAKNIAVTKGPLLPRPGFAPRRYSLRPQLGIRTWPKFFVVYFFRRVSGKGGVGILRQGEREGRRGDKETGRPRGQTARQGDKETWETGRKPPFQMFKWKSQGNPRVRLLRLDFVSQCELPCRRVKIGPSRNRV
jgi:hypothetical protein